MRRSLSAALAGGLLLTLVPLPQSAPSASAACWPRATPSGALPPAMPAWCEMLHRAPPTFRQKRNAWLDRFNHHGQMLTMGRGYRVFNNVNEVNKTVHFRHNDHWMVDVNGFDRDGGAPYNLGGAYLRPARSFRFVKGRRLVVVATVAAGVADYDGNAWPEIVVTTARRPTRTPADSLYSYGWFKGFETVGVRLDSLRVPTVTYYAASGKKFEIAFFRPEGARVSGGGPFTAATDRAWRRCNGTDPDLKCRDRFKLVLTRATITLFVNGVRYMRIALPPGKQLSRALRTKPVYVYFGSWTYKPNAATTRFHWDTVAINPQFFR